jgi:hypothetical protein
MLNLLEIRSPGPLSALARAKNGLRNAFPDLAVKCGRELTPPRKTVVAVEGDAVVVSAMLWRAPDFDPLVLDEAVAAAMTPEGNFALRLIDDAGARGDLFLTALQVVTRCQRHLAGRNRLSSVPLFDAVLAHHRSLHDLSKPLVAADFDHARDTWRWVLRLDAEASLAVQVAALFHDVERLASESEVRVEHQAADYVAFKRAHAAAGATMTGEALKAVGATKPLIDRVMALVAGHETVTDDPEKTTLTEADALSFFSLNAPGFARYYGPDHTARKVAYTLDRLGVRRRLALSGIRHRADIATMIEEALGSRGEVA